jgi:hypothetical protein
MQKKRPQMKSGRFSAFEKLALEHIVGSSVLFTLHGISAKVLQMLLLYCCFGSSQASSPYMEFLQRFFKYGWNQIPTHTCGFVCFFYDALHLQHLPLLPFFLHCASAHRLFLLPLFCPVATCSLTDNITSLDLAFLVSKTATS